MRSRGATTGTQLGLRSWPRPIPPMAPVIPWSAVVDGTVQGLPQVPLRDIQEGRINRSPEGKNLSVIMGTNECEGCFFVIATPFIVKNITLPVKAKDIAAMAQHMVDYHDHWNESTYVSLQVLQPTVCVHRRTLVVSFLITCFLD